MSKLTLDILEEILQDIETTLYQRYVVDVDGIDAQINQRIHFYFQDFSALLVDALIEHGVDD